MMAMNRLFISLESRSKLLFNAFKLRTLWATSLTKVLTQMLPPIAKHADGAMFETMPNNDTNSKVVAIK